MAKVVEKKTTKRTHKPKETENPAEVQEPVISEPAPVETIQQPEVQTDILTWHSDKPAPTNKPKAPIKTRCIVIDKYNRWFEGVPLDLKGWDTSEFEWGYYGSRYPVLVEKNGILMPYLHTDIVSESSTRLWKAAHPEGFRNTFKHTNSTMQKVAIGLMAGILIAMIVLIYAMAN